MIIRVKDLVKVFKTYERGNTLLEVIKGMVVRKYKKINAVDGLTFDIEEGELLGFIGPNGAGKSSTLKILTGVLFPTSGEVRIMGYVPWKDRKKYVGNIGAVFGQKSQLLWDIPPIDAFYLNKAIYGIPHNDFKKSLDFMAEMLTVGDVMRKPTRQLSLGERMKCEFIMAMLHKPKIVFLDEPTIGLDVVAKERIRNFILEMNKNGTTFILTTHDLGDIEQLAHRVMVINNGNIAYDDLMENLKYRFGNIKTIRLLTGASLPEINMKGIRLLNKASEHEAELELDTSELSMNSFIEIINKNCIIKDLSINEPPIENIIKELYEGASQAG